MIERHLKLLNPYLQFENRKVYFKKKLFKNNFFNHCKKLNFNDSHNVGIERD